MQDLPEGPNAYGSNNCLRNFTSLDIALWFNFKSLFMDGTSLCWQAFLANSNGPAAEDWIVSLKVNICDCCSRNSFTWRTTVLLHKRSLAFVASSSNKPCCPLTCRTLFDNAMFDRTAIGPVGKKDGIRPGLELFSSMAWWTRHRCPFEMPFQHQPVLIQLARPPLFCHRVILPFSSLSSIVSDEVRLGINDL